MWIFKKNIIYFQYDYEVFRAQHYKESHVFSYKKHGLGRVVENRKDLIEEIGNILADKEKVLRPYLSRYPYIFKHNDRNASKRIYQAIEEYDKLSDALTTIYRNDPMEKMDIFDVVIKEDNSTFAHKPKLFLRISA